MSRRLRVPFEDLESFRREYEAHIARGGLFVPTLESFAPRELVEVQLELNFCGAAPLLQAEVVARLRPSGSNLGGVALQLLAPTPELRAHLEALTGLTRRPPATFARAGPPRRHERAPARLRALLRSEERSQHTHTLDVSTSGALLPAGDDPVPVGENVRLSLLHPESGEPLEIVARVVRHAVRAGRVEQIAVEFASSPDAAAARRFIDQSLAAAHARSLGRVAGDLAAIGPASLLQMLPASAAQGTLVLRAPEPGRIGCVHFRDGALAFVSLGRLRGAKALCRLLAWTEGRFEYAPEIVHSPEFSPDAGEASTPVLPLPGALLEALQHHDELGSLDRSALPPDARVERRGTRGQQTSKLEQALLDLLARPRRVGELVDAHPAYDVEIYRALLALLDAGAIAVRSGAGSA